MARRKHYVKWSDRKNTKWAYRNRTQSGQTETVCKVVRQKQNTKWAYRNRKQSGQTEIVCKVVRQKQNTKWAYRNNAKCTDRNSM